MIAEQALEQLLAAVQVRLPVGRGAAMRGSDLAGELGISERTLRGLVDDLIDRGWLIGSTCAGDRPGYFICATPEDLEVGIAHLVSRARSLHVRVARLRNTARDTFGDSEPILRLFDLEEVSS